MASQGPHNTSGYSSGQAQIRRTDLQNQDHETDFLQETGTQVTNMIQGAAEIGKGAALGAVSMAKGAAVGAANLAHGAADAVKHTFGTDTNTTITTATDNTSDWPSNSNYHPGAGNTNWPSNTTNHPTRNPKNCPTNATNNLNADATKYPSNLLDDLMDDPAAQDAHWPSHLNNPNTGNI